MVKLTLRKWEDNVCILVKWFIKVVLDIKLGCVN